MSHSYCLLQKCSHYRKQEENKKREIERSLSKKNRIQEAILHKDTTSLRFFPSSYRERHVSFLLWTRSVLEFSIYSIKACNTLPFHSVYFPCPLLLYYTHKKKKKILKDTQSIRTPVTATLYTIAAFRRQEINTPTWNTLYHKFLPLICLLAASVV